MINESNNQGKRATKALRKSFNRAAITTTKKEDPHLEYVFDLEE